MNRPHQPKKSRAQSLRLDRRAVLGWGGIATIVAVGGGVWRAFDQGVFSVGQGPAYAPWRDWRSEPPGSPLAPVRAAILAANPHNSQPWRFRVTPARIDLFADRARNIGAIDPDLREMHTGLGCALENMILAAEANGYAPRVALMPDPSDAAHVARVELTPSVRTVSPLYEAIPSRHTNRAPYDTSRPVPPALLAALERRGGEEARILWFVSEADRRHVGGLIVRATEAIAADPEQSRATERWLRFRWADVERFRDGITIDTNVDSATMRALAKMLPPLSREQGDRFWLEATKRQVATAAGFGLLAVRDARDNAARLMGGRVWQRLQLAATVEGLALQPENQLTERTDREHAGGTDPVYGRALERLVGNPRWQALMTFRFGYPTVQPALSPRRPVDAVLL